jgi:predicted MFS family arabinose efflux permease
VPVVARRHDEGAHAVGLILGAFAVGGMVASLLVRRARARVGAGRLLAFGAMLGAASLVIVAVSGHLSVTMLGMVAAGIAWEIAFVLVMSDAQLLGSGQRATSVGLVFAVLALGISVGAMAAGVLVDAFGLVVTFGVAAAVLAGSSAVSFLLPRAEVR